MRHICEHADQKCALPRPPSVHWPAVHECDASTKRKDRRNATRARKKLDVLYGEIGLLLYHHLEPLKEFFLAGDDRAIDAVIEFLEFDVLSSGTGYQKQ